MKTMTNYHLGMIARDAMINGGENHGSHCFAPYPMTNVLMSLALQNQIHFVVMF